ncbi:MAG: glycosyltransferase [bacterium]|nr:glycosyltransferase [bacterium]
MNFPMNRSLSPPGTTEEIHARSALVLAPHFDDEVLGCGGLVAQLTAAGAVVRVLFLSDGSGDAPAETDRADYSSRRRREAGQAAKVLGLAGIDHLDLPDGSLDQRVDEMAQGIKRALLSLRPELLLVTSPLEGSPDHRAAFLAVHQLLGGVRPGHELAALVAKLRILAYEVNQPLYPNLLVDVSDQVPTIEQAMACYASQQEQHDYLGARLGLLRFRALTLDPEARAVEAYWRLASQDFATRGPARLLAEMGGSPELVAVEQGPTISVVVRTKDRPQLLAEALDSLAAGTYRRAEVVVVNDGGRSPELPDDYPVPLKKVDLETNQGRARAANAGVAAATGEFIAFLDDDDLCEPEHLATLAGLVRGAGVRVAYTDAAVGVYEPDGGEGWRCRERRLPYSRDFDADLLLFDNYIPFNTLLIDRRLFAEVGEFDPELPFFEDWDFLIRLASRTRFHHLARVTCEYRHFRGAGHHILGDDPRERADFLEMKARVLRKHTARLSPEVIARIVDVLRAETVSEQEITARLRADLGEADERFHRLNGRLTSLEIHCKVLEETHGRYEARMREERDEHHRLDRDLARLHAREQELTEELRQTHAQHGDVTCRLDQITEHGQQVSEELRRCYGEIERLNAVIKDMESTRAWRTHQWWQSHKP